MAEGVVVGLGNTDTACPRASYGMWLFIKYDNGLSSLFGHLSVIKVHPGDRVSTGDIVAYSGMTGYATGPHLHLTIIAADAGSIQSFPSKACSGKTYTAPVAALNAYLDPMLYLPKK
jgi:murein DD-endopeptidase MepM/ murein hydrolase activator NlpD